MSEPTETSGTETSRRGFLIATATVAAALGLPVLSTLGDPPSTAPAAGAAAPIDAGALGDFSADGVTETFAKTGKFFIIREDGKLYASSSLCTHKRCVLTFQDNELYCKCHRSEFDLTGVPTAGPAKRPLERYGVTLDDSKHVLVDKSKKFPQEKWDDAGSFLKVG
jgi:cytochrome b6-f complex iron-sulfur subunit